MTAEQLFAGYPDPEPAKPPNATERRRARQTEAVAAGFHPLSLQESDLLPASAALRLLGPDHDGWGQTCGGCAHRVLKRMGNVYPKCDLGPTSSGPATDVLARWPACTRWEPRPS